VPKVMHQALATSSAQPRARNSFIMNKFRELGFIEYNGGLRIKRLLLDVIFHDRFPVLGKREILRRRMSYSVPT